MTPKKTQEAASAATDIAELSPEQRAAQALAFDETKAKLQALAAVSKSLVRVDDDDGLAAANSARTKLVSTRTTIAKTGKAARDGATKFQKAVIAKERELIAVIQPEEDRLATLIEAENRKREEAERVAREAEQRRAELITQTFSRVRSLPELAGTLDVEGIDGLIAEAQKLVDDQSHLPEDMQAAGRYEANVALNACKAARDRRVQADRDAAELAAFRRQAAEREAASLAAAEADKLAAAEEEKPDAVPVHAPTVPAPLEEDDLPPGVPLGKRTQPTVAVSHPRHVGLLPAAKAALALLELHGFGKHRVALDLADAIDDADVPGGVR